MNYFFYILYQNILPLTIMIAIGAVMYRIFKLDIKTLSKLNFYVFSPVLVFVKLYESTLSYAVMIQVIAFFILFLAAIVLMVEVVIRIKRYQGGMKSAMRNSVIFYNSANYAIPLNQMVFVGDSFTLSIQIIIMMFQSLIPNTYGVYSVNAHKSNLKDIFKTIIGMPVIYAIPLAIVLRMLHAPIPEPVNIPLQYIVNGFMVTALITLGVQLGSMKWNFDFSSVILSNFLRLCMGPVIGFLIVWALGIEGIMAKALILSCAVPTSLSSVLLAVEYDNEPEFSAQAVFTSTILSMFTVTLVIYLLQFVP
ncbi:Membrane transport protein [compost metagenome]